MRTVYENGRLVRTPDTYRCDRCGGVCTADEPDQPVEPTSAAAPVAAVDPVAAEAKRVIRHFQKLTSEQRANRAASHRLGHRQRVAVGEYFYTHPDVPSMAFRTRKAAAIAALNQQTATQNGPETMSYDPLYLLTDGDYNARGAVVQDGARWIGYDTAGKKLFSRADHDGMTAAAKRAGLVLVSGAWYGLDEVGTETARTEAKRARRVQGYAAKLAAETIRSEDDPRPIDPTDDALTKAFANCTRPAEVDMYDEIRAAYAALVAAWEDERCEAAKARYAALMNRPAVAAVAARLATLTDEERRHLDAAYRQHFRLFRAAQSTLTHRCGKAYNERAGSKYGYRDVLHVAGQVAWVPQPADPSSFAHNAAEDYVKALLWGDLLNESERPVFTGPWVAVIGEDGPRAEAYVSPWATV